MSKQTILIVEDDRKVVELLKETIEEIGNGCAIKIAYNGKEAVEILEKEKIELALLDIKMPVMDGVQVLTELHNRKIWLPIIILTAYSVKDIEHKLLEFGIVDYLSKPLDIAKLKKRIKEVLKNREQKDSITGMSLAAILQVLEMEQRTGVISIKTDKKSGRIFFKKGMVVDIDAEGLTPEEALGELLDQTNKDQAISIEYLDHRRKERINKSLTEILLEASRLLDEDKNEDKKESKEEPISPKIEKESDTKEGKIENQKVSTLIDRLKEELGEALLSAQVWTLSEGEVFAGYNQQSEVSDLFTQITLYINEALSTAEFPQLGKYYVFNLEGKKISVTIPLGEYFCSVLIDSKKTPLGLLLKVVLPGVIASFEEAI
ncbi:MAG TPA: response regulator, partial [Candidatus Kapabacteria bacterium]|nr:response regulator [Candidatus Kapabacteria bacterium]